MMIESRCGIKCSECEFKVDETCKGCTKIVKPFWADVCPVKACCEGRGLENCGWCDLIPCDLLNSFAYDKEQGDDGRRIDQCHQWRKAINT